MAHRNILDEIGKAKVLYASHGEAMTTDIEIRFLVEDYRRAVAKTSDSMRSMGIGEACAACAAKDPGGCCFRGIEDGYDHVLLLANLLLGCSLPDAAELPGGCFFVGSSGCRLSARYYFCLHYFCPDLVKVLGSEKIENLLGILGEELSIGWRLELALRRWLSTRHPEVV